MRFSDDEIFLSDDRKKITILPPIRWSFDGGRIDYVNLNFKSPEGLNLEKAANLDENHKRMIWKIGLILYQCVSSRLPWTFKEANKGVLVRKKKIILQRIQKVNQLLEKIQ